MNKSNTTPKDYVTAWAFVLQHRDLVERITRKLGIATPLALDDYRSEVIADLVDTFDRYTPERGSPSTWIWMRAAKVRRGLVRQGIRNSSDVDWTDALPDVIDVGGLRRNPYGPERMVAAAEVAILAARRPSAREHFERTVNG